MSDKNKCWFAVYTKPRWEKKVAQLLTEKGIENYCPLHRVVKQWSDRKKVIVEPVFKSYVFVKLNENNKWDIKKVSGVLNFVYWLGKPALIRDEEILTIKKFLSDFPDATVQVEDLIKNARIRIKGGVLMNYEGTVTELHGNMVYVRIESMGIVLSAKIDKKNLTIIPCSTEKK